MSINIMQQYITLTKKELTEYIKLILGTKFVKHISDEYLDMYVKFRYYNYYGCDIGNKTKKMYLELLENKKLELYKEYPKKKKYIENTANIYSNIFKLENLHLMHNVNTIIEDLESLLLKDNESFKEDFYNKTKEYKQNKLELLKKLETNKFHLGMKKYFNKRNIYSVELENDIKFPMVYSEKAIRSVFNSGIVLENKLFVAYYLIVLEVIKDIENSNFKKQYLVDIEPSLFKKSKKIKSLLNIVYDGAIQEKISFKIKYKDFLENKQFVYELMRQGFKIAIIIDKSFVVDNLNIEKLNVFSYIIINRKSRHYKDINNSENLQEIILEV